LLYLFTLKHYQSFQPDYLTVLTRISVSLSVSSKAQSCKDRIPCNFWKISLCNWGQLGLCLMTTELFHPYFNNSPVMQVHALSGISDPSCQKCLTQILASFCHFKTELLQCFTGRPSR